ncbi:MAG: LysR family transcriptional regulator [Pseudomonadota bacterium]
MESWDEIKTAYHVARIGTVSGAAEVLGVHHATVIRHVDAVEGRLGVKLFQRHARGYTPTEAGEELLRVAQATDDQFHQLFGRMKGQGSDVSGELVVTSLVSMAAEMAQALVGFQAAHPGVRVRYVTGARLFRLEYGEAHVAIRAGLAPDQLDNVVQPLTEFEIAGFASRDYVARHGVPRGPEDYAQHSFIGPDDRESRAPYHVWLKDAVPEAAVRFRCSDDRAALAALSAGAGIGFMSTTAAAGLPDLAQVLAPRPEWAVPLWLVTHVDLHRTSKVQALLKFLKAHVKAHPW